MRFKEHSLEHRARLKFLCEHTAMNNKSAHILLKRIGKCITILACLKQEMHFNKIALPFKFWIVLFELLFKVDKDRIN